MSSFWRTWMTSWCWAVGLFGLILAGGAFAATSGPTRLLYGVLNASEPFATGVSMRFTLAVLGAVTIGWSLTLLAAIRAAGLLDPRPAKPIWRLIAASVAVWYAIDSALSAATGFGLNIAPNTVFAAAFLVPMLRTGVLRP